MKFFANSQAFAKQMQLVSGIITTSQTVPIINCFHFLLQENKLTVKATDLETTIITDIDVDSTSSDGLNEVAVPAKMLMDILKSLDDMPINVSVNENFAITITAGDGVYTLNGLNPETFPALPKIEDTSVATIPATALVSAISKTSFATGNDEMRPQMCGIFCEMTPEGTTFVSTDSHKMVRFIRKDAKSDENSSFILPKKPLMLVKNILSVKDSQDEPINVVIEYNKMNAAFRFGTTNIYCRLVDGQYPNYSAAIPKDNPNKLTIDRITLLNTLRRVGLFANQSTHQVRLEVNEHELAISAEDLEFANRADEKIACVYEGEPMAIGFNEKFLSEMLSNLNSENVLITLSHPSRAGIIYPINDDPESVEDTLMLVMPVMLAN